VNSLKCIDSIALGDGREVFVIDDSFKIITFIDEKCLVLKDGYVKEK